MFEAFRNSIFKVCAEYVRAGSHATYLPINSRATQALAQRFQKYKEAQALQVAQENILDTVEKSLNEYESKEFKILRRYMTEGRTNAAVNARHIREQLDIIQIAKNLKFEMIEANEQDYDPEYVKFEKLKARVLLEEQGAKEEFVEYVKQRPYLRSYLKWADEFERNQIKIWPLI